MPWLTVSNGAAEHHVVAAPCVIGPQGSRCGRPRENAGSQQRRYHHRRQRDVSANLCKFVSQRAPGGTFGASSIARFFAEVPMMAREFPDTFDGALTKIVVSA